MANNPDQDLPDRPDLRNEMSRVPFFFFSFLALAAFAGSAYQYFVIKDAEMGKMLAITGVVIAAFTIIHRFVTSRLSKQH